MYNKMSMKERIMDIISMLVITFVFILFLWRAFKGFCQSDESLYIAFMDRIWKGDRLIIDEWHPVQLFSFLTYPLYWIFRIIKSDSEGVILYFRIVHLFFSTFIGIWWYITFGKIGNRILILCSTLIYMAYSRSSIDGMNYYKISVSLMVVTIIIMYKLLILRFDNRQNDIEISSRQKRHILLYEVLLGLILAAQVLSMPYMIVTIIFVYCVYIILIFRNKNNRENCLKYTYKDLMAIFSGSAFLAFLFLFFGEKGDLFKLIKNLHNLFMDSGHQKTIASHIAGTLIELFTYNMQYSVIMGVVLASVVFYLYKIKGLKEKVVEGRILCSLSILLTVILYYIVFGLRQEEGFVCVNVIAMLLSLLIICYFYECIISKITIYGTVLGVLLSGCYCLGSNTGISATCTGLVVVTMMWIVYIAHDIKEQSEIDDNAIKINIYSSIMVCAMVILTIGSISHHVTSIYRDAKLDKLVYRVDSGVGKGLYTTVDNIEEINIVHQMLTDLNDKYNGASLCISRLLPWMYIEWDGTYGTYTAWRVDLWSGQLELWMESHQTVDIIVCLDENVGDGMMNEQIMSVEMENWLLENYTEYSYECGKVYVLNGLVIR